jgi:hypothetical protein
MDRKSLPGVDELIKCDNLDGVVGKVVNKIKEKHKERKLLSRRVEEKFIEWNKLFIELNRLDGELDALEVIALEESENYDIINKIVEGAKLADEERITQMESIMKKSPSRNIGGMIGGLNNPFGGPRRR